MSSLLGKIKDTGHYVSDKTKGHSAQASKEVNQEVAKGHTGARLSERVRAAGNAVFDKVDESSYKSKAAVHKESAKH